MVRMGKHRRRLAPPADTAPTRGSAASSSTGFVLWVPMPRTSSPSSIEWNHWPLAIRHPTAGRWKHIFFHPETSIRRALILAMGSYKAEDLPPDERERLSNKLIAIYRDDPDAGIHGAAEWTLRQWKHEEQLKKADADLMKLEIGAIGGGSSTPQGQTFALIDGPVEFTMGSPDTEPERNRHRTPFAESPFHAAMPSPQRK